jgi:hypothetical protein
MSRVAATSLALLLIASTSVRADNLRGVVRDQSGNPISGARVDIATAAPKIGRGMFCPSCYLDCAKWAKTDAQGEFELKSLDSKLKFTLLSTAPGKQTHITTHLDPRVDSAEIVLEDFPVDVPSERILTGLVVGESATPIPGALVEPVYSVTGKPSVTDDDGRFRMLLTGHSAVVDVSVTATGYAGMTVLRLEPGESEHRIVVPSGTEVRGKLVGEGQPLANAQIAVVQTNRFSTNHFIKAVQGITDQQGDFVISALPGNQEYAVFTPIGSRTELGETVIQTKLFQAEVSGLVKDLGTLETRKGLSLSGQVVMPDGAPVPADLKLSLGRDPAWDLIELPVDTTGRFEITDLPSEGYEVHMMSAGWGVDLSQMPFQPIRENTFALYLDRSREDLRIALRPSTEESPARIQKARPKLVRSMDDSSGVQVTCRILRDAMPVEGTTVSLERFQQDGGNRWKSVGRSSKKTDAEGRFRFEGLAAGEGYWCEIEFRDNESASGWDFQRRLQIIEKDFAGVIELPDANLVAANQTLSGVVVDPMNQPVKGVIVTARLANWGQISGRPNGTSSDEAGRFELTNLPSEPIHLSAQVERFGRRGVRIRYPAEVLPTINQSDIRIVFDPALQTPLERIGDE